MAYYPDDNTRPTREFLDRMLQHAKAKNTKLHAKMEEYEDDYFLEVTGDDDSDGNAVYLSDLHDAVNMARDILASGKYRINFRRPGNSEVDREYAEALERFVRNAITSASLRNGYDVEARLVEYQMRESLGVLHWAYNPALVEGSDPLYTPPIDIWAVDPKNFFPVLGGPQGGFRYIFYVEARSVEDAYQLARTIAADNPDALQQLDYYFHTLDDYGRNSTQYELSDYWGWHEVDGQWVIANAIRFGDAILRPLTPMPGYTHFPWAIAPARDTGHIDHEKRWLPLTYGARGHVRRAERLQGTYDLLLEKMGIVPNIIEVTEEAPTPPNIVSDPAYAVTLYRGQRWIPPNLQGLPPDFWRQVDLAQDRIERAAFPRAMYGIGVESGYGFDKAQEGSRSKLNAPRLGLEQGMTALAVGMMGLISTLFPESFVHVTSIKKQGNKPLLELIGSDLNPANWEVSVRWSAQMPGDESRMAAIFSQVTGTGGMSKETGRERYLHVDDSKAEGERIIREQAMSADPRIAQAYAYEVLQKMDAMPNFEAEQILQIISKVEELRGKGKALNMPPEVIEAGIQAFVQGAMMTQQQQYAAFAQGKDPNAGQAPRQPQGQPGIPPAVQAQMAGQAPPGNPSDLGAPLREQANAMNGVTGERQ